MGPSHAAVIKQSKNRFNNTVKPVLSSHSKRTQKLFFNTDYLLMQVKSIAVLLSTFIKLPFSI